MAYSPGQVNNVIDALGRAPSIHAKIVRLNQLGKLEVDENSDLEIGNGAQLAAYVNLLTTRRDAIIAQVQPVVAAWTP